MADDSKKSAQGAGSGPVAGERLAEARRLRQISLPDVARQLHLDEPRVQALEENRFDVLGAPVFAKGYLRKYAKLVGVSIDDVMADYYTLNRATGAPPVVGRPRRQPRVIDPRPWLRGLLVIIGLAALAYATWWWLQRLPANSPPAMTGTRMPVTPSAARDAAERAVPATAGAANDAAAAATELPDAGAADTMPAEAAPQATLPVPGTAARTADRPAAASGATIELTLNYSGDCWTEVSDADGRRLYFDLGTGGSTVTVSGRAPLRVLVGNEENVRLSVNGRPHTITAANRRGNTARFSINP